MIVVDTHVLVWWANSDLNKLSQIARSHLAKAEKIDGGIIVSTISSWEIAILVSKGRLTLAMDVEDWLNHVAALPGVRFLPIDRHIAVQSVRLPQPFHQDQADRMIVSTARALNFPLITADQGILKYNHVKTVW
jgi:PIN domain nuclease of toxin-antitoxin system